MASTVDGIISGLNTSQMISQLMQIEAAPQTALKGKVTAEQKTISAYQSVNTKLSALQSAADALTKSTTWQSVKASSSSTSVTATATAGAPPAEYTFDVTQLAKAQISTAVVNPAGPVTSAGTIQLSINGGTVDVVVDPANDTPQGVAAAINAAGLDIRASVLETPQGTVLQIQGTKTGLHNAFTITGLASAPQQASAAQDAEITFGTGAGAYTMTSETNTFTNVIPNASITVSKLETGVTVSVTADGSGIADKMQAMVDAANVALGDLASQSTYNSTSKTAGPLAGNYAVRQLQQGLLSAVSNGNAGFGSYSQIGISLDSSGKLKFDRDAFVKAYEADPAKTETVVSTGVATTMVDLAKGATDKISGTITLAIQGGNDHIKRLNDEIANWDIRLTTRRTTLQRQFTNLETALSKMKNQSTWLSGQIASLGQR